MTIDEGERLHRNAASYRVVALDLYAELDRNSDLVQLRLDHRPTEPTLRIVGCTYSSVMLRALATELALKALAYHRKGRCLTEKKRTRPAGAVRRPGRTRQELPIVPLAASTISGGVYHSQASSLLRTAMRWVEVD